MRKLIALISPEGKTKEQLASEMHGAVQKYFKVEKKANNFDSLEELKQTPGDTKEAFIVFHDKKSSQK